MSDKEKTSEGELLMSHDINDERYSTYFKCDLHIHTDYSNKTKENDYKGIFNLQKLVEVISDPKNDIKMFSLTDHNIINTNAYEEYYNNKAFNTSDRCLLVGVELDIIREDYLEKMIENTLLGSKCDVKKYHSIIIFKSNNANHLNDKLNEMYKAISDDYNNKHENKIDLNNETKHLKNRITSFDRFAETFIDEDYLVISHGNKSANIKDAYGSYKSGLSEAQVMVLLGIVDALEMSPGNNSKIISHFNKGFQSLLTCDYSAKKEVPYVVFSDNHQINAYPKHDRSQTLSDYYYTWLKGDLSFETLRMSFVDPTSRIFVSSKAPQLPDKYIEEVSFNYVCNNSKKAHSINLSPGINAIIGGRSSGKSLLFNSILYSLSQGKNKAKVDNYIKENNSVLDLESIKSKMNYENNFKKENICEIYAFTQEGIISLFEKNGEGLKDHLDFERLELNEINEKTNIYNGLVDHFTNAYSDLLVRKDHYKNSMPIAMFKEASKKLSEKYVYKNTIQSLKKTEISILDTQKIINKLASGKVEAESISKLKLKGKNIFDDEEQKIIKNYINLLSKKHIEIKRLQRKNKIKNTFLSSLDRALSDIANRKITEETVRIENAKNSIDSELNKIYEYFKSKMFFEKYAKDLEKASIKIDEKNKVISPNYTLNTRVDNIINIEFLNEILQDKISHYNKDKTLKENFIDLLDNKIKINRKQNTSENVIDLFTLVKNSINKSLTPRYTIVENNNSISLNSDNMSQGKKASIYLEIILEKCKNTNKIIMIDQPEDNIDNGFITDVLIDKIRELRGKNQVILVTHNAAIAINSDSDNVIIAENDDGQFKYEMGGLEKIEHRKKICKLLDGGYYIFDNRYHKYNIFNDKVNEPIRKDEINE